MYQSSVGDEDQDEVPVVDKDKAADEARNGAGDKNTTDSAVSASGSSFLKIGDVMVRPAVEMCLNAAEAKKRSRPGWDMDVFILNCLSYLLVCHVHFLDHHIESCLVECIGAIWIHKSPASHDSGDD